MSAANASPRPTLLVVDDDLDVLLALSFVAEARGFDVERCSTAGEAIALARSGRRFSCLIVDQLLGDDRGIDVLAVLRSGGIETPAVVITTAPSELLRRRAAAAGAPIVEKPLLDEMLFTEIERLMRTD